MAKRIGDSGQESGLSGNGRVGKRGDPVQAAGVLVHLPEVEVAVVLVGDGVDGVAHRVERPSDLGDAVGDAGGGVNVAPSDIQVTAAGIRDAGQEVLVDAADGDVQAIGEELVHFRGGR